MKYGKWYVAKAKMPIPARVFQDPLLFVAFGFGSGIAPFAPGTFGTLLAAILYALLPAMSFMTQLIGTLCVVAFCIWICSLASRRIAVHDHPGMCLDEFAGFAVAMLGSPNRFPYLVAAFLLFRFFDIIKPWPISWADKHIHGGFGMVFDDVLAGAVTALLLCCVRLF
jgi:phosphatidylglycerophosphatase A